MKIKIIMVAIVQLVMFFSLYNLLKFLSEHQKEMSQVSSIRIQILFVLHITYSLSCLIILTISSCQNQLVFLVFQCFLTFICFFYAQTTIKTSKVRQVDQLNRFSLIQKNPIEELYLLIYKKIYIGSLIGFFLFGIIVVIKQVISYYQKKKFDLKAYINKSVQQIQYHQTCRQDICSICLTPFQEKEGILKIKKCQHIFHQQCLNNWVQMNKSCPLDRYDITKYEVENNGQQ